MKKSYTRYDNLENFISNINGNWRNSIYITCSICKYDRQECCDDCMVSFDNEGRPAVIGVVDANYIFGTVIDKSECLAEMSNAKFKCLFENYFNEKTSDEDSLCPFLQLISGKNREKKKRYREK